MSNISFTLLPTSVNALNTIFLNSVTFFIALPKVSSNFFFIASPRAVKITFKKAIVPLKIATVVSQLEIIIDIATMTRPIPVAAARPRTLRVTKRIPIAKILAAFLPAIKIKLYAFCIPVAIPKVVLAEIITAFKLKYPRAAPAKIATSPTKAPVTATITAIAFTVLSSISEIFLAIAERASAAAFIVGAKAAPKVTAIASKDTLNLSKAIDVVACLTAKASAKVAAAACSSAKSFNWLVKSPACAPVSANKIPCASVEPKSFSIDF